MDYPANQIELFFNKYEERFNNALKGENVNTHETVNAFSLYFIEAGRHGINCGKNDHAFRKAISEGYAFYRNIGITSMKILNMTITPLNQFHAMAKISWQSEFTSRDQISGTINFEVIYLLQLINEEVKIFAYITGDEQAALKAHNLI